jgi:dephospho-CoA kinase
MICPTRPKRIGLTGGIGSGKSTVAAMFACLGAPVLDLDQLGRRLVTDDAECLQQLVCVFGETILHPDGTLNRKALARLAFADARQTARLNAVMHPLIRQGEEAWLNRQQADYVIIEASVLIESGGAGRMDAVIAVLAREDIRLQRVVARGHQDEEEFQAIVARQCSDRQRRRIASYIIENNGGRKALQGRVCNIHLALQQAFSSCNFP